VWGNYVGQVADVEGALGEGAHCRRRGTRRGAWRGARRARRRKISGIRWAGIGRWKTHGSTRGLGRRIHEHPLQKPQTGVRLRSHVKTIGFHSPTVDPLLTSSDSESHVLRPGSHQTLAIKVC
jgi:hypothetical protein